MSGSRFLAGTLTALLALGGTNALAAPAKRAIILSWDGAADWVVDKLLAEGKLPNVARLAKMGARADYCIPAYPSKTACGHAAIWTGCYGEVNGITGNAVPVLPQTEHTILETRSGFDSRALKAEPLWITAAKAGKKVVILSAAQSYPPDPHLEALHAVNVPPDRFTSFSGFESGIQDGKVWKASDLQDGANEKTLSFKVGEQEFAARVYDDPNDPTQGYDTVAIQEKASGKSATMKPREAATDTNAWSPAFRVTKGDLFGNVYFRLFSLAPNGGEMTLYQRTANGLQGAASRAETETYLEAYGGFHDDPFGRYENGEFGATLWQGGDGTAEKRALELVRLDCAFLKRSVRYALKRWKPDLLFHYTPMSDSAGHTWMGALDPASPAYRPDLAAKLWDCYAQVFQLQDEWLGDVLDQIDKETVVCLVSDHGMEGISKMFSPNAVLEKAGLLKWSEDRIVLSETKVCTPGWGDFFVCVNRILWKDGVVAPSEEEEALQKATEALLNATDPETGKRIVSRVFRAGEIVGVGIGGAPGGDLYLDLVPGYVPTSRYIASIVEKESSPIGGGVHGFYPYRAKMQAICYLGGAGIKPNSRLSGIRQIDIAPTLAHLLGIPAPKDATGHILGETFR